MVIRRWVSGPPAAHWRREVHLIQQGPAWIVRQVGQVNMPDGIYATDVEAMDRVCELIGPDWVEVEPYPR